MKRTHIVIHYTAGEEKDAKQVIDYHRSIGWRDVGYNFIIEKSGKLVLGRPLNIPGAHARAGSMNTLGIGIVLIGNFEKRPPAPEQYATLIGLLMRLMPEHGIPLANVIGHGTRFGGFGATLCPGKYFNLKYVKEELAPNPSPAIVNDKNVYIVKPGDTLWKIAKDNGTTVEALDKLNDIDNLAEIYPGQRIIVKGAAAATPAPKGS